MRRWSCREFAAGILGDGAKLVVDVGDLATGIGDGDNGVFIQRSSQVASFFERGLEPIFSQFALRDVRADGDILAGFASSLRKGTMVVSTQ